MLCGLAALVNRIGVRRLIATHGDQLNEYIHWHVEEGRKLTGPYLARVEAKRTALFQRLCGFKNGLITSCCRKSGAAV